LYSVTDVTHDRNKVDDTSLTVVARILNSEQE
jgi:hypothetical protein